tara:strand:- start:637 stop:1398 length:762 start_codon:yes stop_codon:yes gene_type:complete
MLKKIVSKFFRKKIGFFGNYKSFSDALKKCEGYHNYNLIKHIYNQNILAIKKNKYEQDGVIYDSPIINKFILNFFLKNIIENKNFNPNQKIKILDYGGSFGNLYYALRNFIHLNFEWDIIEQKRKVDLAKNNKYLEAINFKHNLGRYKKYDLIIFNTSYQYLRDPFLNFNKLRTRSDSFIFTNIILNNSKKNYIKIEHPDPKVYDYKYPCWFFSKQFLLNNLFKEFKIIKNKIQNPPYPLLRHENYYNILLKK